MTGGRSLYMLALLQWRVLIMTFLSLVSGINRKRQPCSANLRFIQLVKCLKGMETCARYRGMYLLSREIESQNNGALNWSSVGPSSHY
jgi:hypothetical protein